MKFEKEDQSYLTLWKVNSQGIRPREIWPVIDHWFLYVGIRNLARYMAISESAKIILYSLHDRLSKSGFFIFNEWNSQQGLGETLVVKKFLEDYSCSYEMLHVLHTARPSLVLRKNRC